MTVHPLVRLARPALAPTAAADVVAAALVVGGARLMPVIAAALASMCIYAGGMMQNDLVDRERDARLHPRRPLVKNPGLARGALAWMVVLFAVGIALASQAGAQWPAVLVILLASAYNVGAKRYFPADAVVLGAARAANLWIGFRVAGASLNAETLTYMLGYLLFIGGVTAASRSEEAASAGKRRLGLVLSLLPMGIGFGAFASLGTEWRAVFAVPGALLVAAVLWAVWKGTREAAMRFVLRSLLCIFVVHAAILWTRGKWIATLPIAGLAALSILALRLLAAPEPAAPDSAAETAADAASGS